jgi:hypothetical protein
MESSSSGKVVLMNVQTDTTIRRIPLRSSHSLLSFQGKNNLMQESARKETPLFFRKEEKGGWVGI